ncbi:MULTISPECIES: hypothetical protein [unclassified Bradyrhizobium]|uniref:hypothetical protein n=1 Tax=unclassified Bradyrhizobium TaxID=2631580 RepID=UPI002916BF95|nr:MULTISPECIES: hypothetical protein [unclassified Bradyrhizobium]
MERSRTMSQGVDQTDQERRADPPRHARLGRDQDRASAASARLVSIAAAALALALTGCVTDQSPAAVVAAAPGPLKPIPPGQAAITIKRVEGYFAQAVKADVDVNGARFASLDQGSSFTGFVRPGPVALTVTCWCGPGRYTVNFKADAGRRYAFEITSRNEQAGAMIAAGIVGLAIDTAANGETSGSFKIVEVAGDH